MKATVVSIRHPNQHMSPRIIVRVRGREQRLDTYRHQELYDSLRVGDTIEVGRQPNNPFLQPVNQEE